jgi:hypothetical protein
MEDILEVYKRPYHAEYPVVCIDEMPVQLLMDVHPPSSPKPGQPARQDYEYERNGVENLFMVFEPLRGKRFVFVTSLQKADLSTTETTEIAETNSNFIFQ